VTYVAVAAYLASIVLANLLISWFGPWLMPGVAFAFIGLDLALRDGLHDAWAGAVRGRMLALIGAGSALTYAIQPGAGRVALASAVAFGAAMGVDAWTYDWLGAWRYQVRANASNASGALVDSVLFPTLAFGAFLPGPIALQFGAKALGGAVWAWLIDQGRRRWARWACVSAFLLAFVPGVASGQSLHVTGHYDVRRQEPIVGLVHETPLPGKFYSTGYVEVWRNPPVGTPAGEWTAFSKHWITRPVVGNLSVSLEVSIMFNRPGVAFRWPTRTTFFEDGPGPHVTIKPGLQYQIY
jgi:hypothetical protein